MKELSRLAGYGFIVCFGHVSRRLRTDRFDRNLFSRYNFSFLLLFLVATGVCQTPILNETQRLLPDELGAFDLFGRSAAISGNRAVIGTGVFSSSVGNAAAYVYEFDGSSWNLEERLVSDDPTIFDGFGTRVAISGSQILVGAERDNRFNYGAAYNFNSDLSSRQKLTPGSTARDQLFGVSVAVSDEFALVGAFGDNGVQGAAYFYRLNPDGSADLIGKVTASDGVPGDYFGIAVAISGNTAVIGAPQDEEGGTRSGAAYVFTEADGDWVETDKIVPSDGRNGDQYGSSVAISGNRTLIGAPTADDFTTDIGAVYAYLLDNGEGIQEQKLISSRPRRISLYGNSVAISGNTAVVGAPKDDFSDRGIAYVYSLDEGNWVESYRLQQSPGNRENDAQFGISVAVSGSMIIAGAFGDDDPDKGDNVGVAYAYILPDTDPPVITASNISVDTDGGLCSAEISLADLIVQAGVTAIDDNDGPVTPTLSVGVVEITTSYTFPTGDTQVTVSAEDAAGNEAQEQFMVTVEDIAPPVFEPVDNLLRSPEKKLDGATIVYDLPVASDNCALAGPPTLTAGLGSGSFFPIGTTTETYTVSDVNGNSSSISFTVTISDDLGIVSFDLIPVGKQKKQKKPKKGELPTNPNSIRPLESGDVIDLADPATEAFSIATSTNRKAGSVVFLLNGALIRTDNKAPYTATENDKQVQALDLTPGDYVLEAIPYKDQDGAGDEGFSLAISFQVIDSDSPSEKQFVSASVTDPSTSDSDITDVLGFVSKVYPNPVTTHLTVEVESSVAEEARVTIVDLAGRTLLSQHLFLIEGKNTLLVDLEGVSMPAGVTILNIRTATQGHSFHRLLMSND